ncbi:TetR/AcrR family transcriptional regulator [Paractinoplanes durhamensis]|uniref:TetR family transcriptional regulator n=1 Tax=Paractinoplanes durhamensis TaxID=113563 RepID=A0ABQ3YX56_9ACTN|nr:TetR/AcrR family transcriptional regulator [Actinoplanes durhamensis]GIE02121.1 TetR family transcriptional regulator [Actinoplanes durhamensis]
MDEVRAAIVAAAGRLLREEGAAAVTTRAVSQAAGVQPPTIYRLFGDKDGLLDAVAEDAMGTYVDGKSIDDGLDPVADLRNGWRHHLAFGLANPDLFLLLSEPRRSGSPAVAAGTEVLRKRVHRLAATGRLRVDEQRAVDMIHAAGTGAVLAIMTGAADGLGEAMFDAVAAAILTDRPALPADDTRTVAVAFAAVVDDLPALSTAERALLTEWLDKAIKDRS